MKTIEHILKTIFLVVVLIGIGAPQAFSQFNAKGKGSTEQLGHTESKAVIKEAKRLLKEIERKEKEVYGILQEDAPKRVKERHLEKFKMYVSQCNAFIVECGLEPYTSPLIEQSGITEPQTASKSNDIITLTVSADGPTKDDAVKNALRAAIEQTYGAFVSANTTILNDELVNDEIITVSNGSIKEYKEISSAQMPNGSYNVTLFASVSLPNLITYAKNHGSECEFAGNTFGMEMRLFDLQKTNERKAILNLNSQLRGLLPHLISWKIELEEPRIPSSHLRDDVIYNEDLAMRLATLKDGTVNQDLFEKIKDMRFDNFYEVSANIYAIMPENDIISETLKRLSISYDEFKTYQDRGLKLGYYNYSNPGQSGGYTDETLFFRNENIKQLMDSIHETVADACTNFVITDNLGNHHCLYNDEIKASSNNENCVFDDIFSPVGIYHGDNINVLRSFKDNRSEIVVVSLKGDELFSYPVSINSMGNYYDGFYDVLKGNYDTLNVHYPKPGTTYPLGGITFYIPRNEIGKYSSFKIEPKE